MPALTTVFTASSWCSNRFAVFVDDSAPGTSIIPPSSGWVDPSFTKCIPTQYTSEYPTFSPGVCPAHMGIVHHQTGVRNGNTIYTATCCQRYLPFQRDSREPAIDDASGFSPVSTDSGYLCTSAITSPMAFLLDPNISTADVYTTLEPELWIEHDQVTVEWEPTDLGRLPARVASQYAVMMGITTPPATDDGATETAKTALSFTSTSTSARKSVTSVFWPTHSPPTSTSETVMPGPGPSTPGSETTVTPASDATPQALGNLTSLVFLLILFNLVV
ncbi:hypothetical protein NUW58_g1705 [Xylaria curta]|uniref:Uncharacterized protein n=1 Tax=Xylaria curta TaxID=42375 RepID=A0ACC1PJ37_9PEZI|nr:hypothetical protein NUW58_g1705 [Xylaria curta]